MKRTSLAIHHQNIFKLTLEFYKVEHHKASQKACELFSQVNLQYNLRKDVKFRFHDIRTVLYGTKILSYL